MFPHKYKILIEKYNKHQRIISLEAILLRVKLIEIQTVSKLILFLICRILCVNNLHDFNKHWKICFLFPPLKGKNTKKKEFVFLKGFTADFYRNYFFL